MVIDLKIGDFLPEYVGKMNFYLSAVDKLLRHNEDRLSVGLILCKAKNRVIAEYALHDLAKPMGVATYKLARFLPKSLLSSLPTIQELEKGLAKERKKIISR